MHQGLFTALGAPAVDVRFVGGAVRNALMGRDIRDIDIATPETPDVVLARLVKAGMRAIPTGLDHGTITAVTDAGTAEITSLRRDTACDGRHAAVEFTTDWEEDARRRDFTINAMSLRPDGTLFDYHGGAEDAKAGRVRFVGDPADRIQEDYLRILRLFRFFAQFGRVPIDGATLSAVKAHAAGLSVLSAERIGQEMMKLLAAGNPAPAMALMTATGVLEQILPDARTGDLARLVDNEQRHEVAPDAVRRLAYLNAPEAAQRLKLSNAGATRLALLTSPQPDLTAATLDRALYHLGADVVRDRLLIADGPHDLFARVRAWTAKTLPVSGADVLALGIAPGPAVGKLLREVEAWWIERGFIPDRAEGLAELAKRASQA